VSEAITVAPVPKTRIRLAQAALDLDTSYWKLRRMAVEEHEFTVIRDGIGKGYVLFLRQDEVNVYDAGGLEALRKFRTKMGRTRGKK
jgi:hypothetical protein